MLGQAGRVEVVVAGGVVVVELVAEVVAAVAVAVAVARGPLLLCFTRPGCGS